MPRYEFYAVVLLTFVHWEALTATRLRVGRSSASAVLIRPVRLADGQRRDLRPSTSGLKAFRLEPGLLVALRHASCPATDGLIRSLGLGGQLRGSVLLGLGLPAHGLRAVCTREGSPWRLEEERQRSRPASTSRRMRETHWCCCFLRAVRVPGYLPPQRPRLPPRNTACRTRRSPPRGFWPW